MFLIGSVSMGCPRLWDGIPIRVPGEWTDFCGYGGKCTLEASTSTEL